MNDTYTVRPYAKRGSGAAALTGLGWGVHGMACIISEKTDGPSTSLPLASFLPSPVINLEGGRPTDDIDARARAGRGGGSTRRNREGKRKAGWLALLILKRRPLVHRRENSQ